MTADGLPADAASGDGATRGAPPGDTSPNETAPADASTADAMRLVEAMVFASAEPVTPRQLAQLLPDLADPELVLRGVAAAYAGRGVRLVEVAGGWQFRTAPELAPLLRRVVPQPRRLPRAAMEVLAVVAYHQPVTRPEIEDLRGAALSQQTLELLLEEGLIASQGRKEVPGRPTLWGTTPAFLGLFGLRSLRDLPRREDLLIEPAAPAAAAPASAPASDAAAAGGDADPATTADDRQAAPRG